MEHLVHVTVPVRDVAGRREVPAASRLQRARTLRGPSDDLQPRSLRCNRILRGLVASIRRLQEHLHRRRDVLDALGDVRREVVVRRARCEGAIAIVFIEEHGLRAEGRPVVRDPGLDVRHVEGLGPHLGGRNAGVHVLLDKLRADLVISHGQASLGVCLQLWRELPAIHLDEVDGLGVTHKSAASRIQVCAPTSSPAEELHDRRGLCVGGVHLAAQALEFRRGEVRGAASRRRICAGGTVVRREGRRAL
mmetsp:Transcript_68138/g.190855  ORF Transcript_68138/g.190855 Transcript_68138/m.190855 type:complete len:249 (+) Transcript_68138:536-1282(+)